MHCLAGRKDIPVNENEIGTIVVNEAIRLHKALGPGLLETRFTR